MKEEKEFTIKITTREHPGCFGKDCEGEHFVKYLEIKTKYTTFLFQEGHPAYSFFTRFMYDHPKIIRDMHTIRAEAIKDEKKYMIERVITELEEYLHNKQ
jgi:hypothetical protein